MPKQGRKPQPINQPSPSDIRGAASGSANAATSDLAQVIAAAIEQGFTSVLAKIDPASLPAGASMAAVSGAVGTGTAGTGTLPIATTGGGAGGSAPAGMPPVAMPEGSPGIGGEKKESGEGGEKKEGLKWAGSPGEFWSRIKDSAFEERLGVVFPTLELGASYAKRTERLDSGAFVSPEERRSANVEALSPAAGIVGAAVGTGLLGAPGALIGSAIGQSIGEIGAAKYGASQERAQTARETSEVFGTATGKSEEEIHRFTEALRDSGAALKEMQQAINTLTNSGPGVGAGTLAGAAFMSTGLMERFNPALAGVVSGMGADPMLRGAVENISATGSHLDPRVLGDLSVYFAGGGDPKTAVDARTLEGRANTNPKWAKDTNFVDREEGRGPSPLSLEGLKQGWADEWHPSRIGAYGAAKRRVKSEHAEKFDDLLGETVKDNDAASEGWNDWQEKITLTGTQAERFTTLIGTKRETTGASDAELGALAKQAYGAIDQRIAADQTYITGQEEGLAKVNELLKDKSLDKDSRAFEMHVQRALSQRIGAAQLDIAGSQATENKERRYLFTRELNDAESGFGLTQALDAYNGRSARAIGNDLTTHALYLKSVASDPTVPLTPGEKDSLTAESYKLRFEAFQGEFSERESLYTSRTTRERLTGRSASSLQHEADRQASYLTDTAADASTPLSPSERENLRTEAVSLRYGAARAVDNERFEKINVHGTADLAGLAKAQATGSDQDVFNAGTRVVEDFKSKIKELSDELARGGLTVADRLSKEEALNTLRGQQSAYQTANTRERDANAIGQAADQVTIDTLGLGRQVRLGGSGSVDTAKLDTTFQGLFKADQADIDDKAAGSRERRDAEAKLATDRQRYTDLTDQLNVFVPTAASRTEDTKATGNLDREERAFRRSQLDPFTDGPNTDIFSRGLQLEADYDKDNRRLQSRIDALDAGKKQRQALGPTVWTDDAENTYQQQRNGLLGDIETNKDKKAGIDHERFFGMLEALPETIAGSPGGGVGAALIASSALSAYFNPNEISGHWGTQNRAQQILGPAAKPGGTPPPGTGHTDVLGAVTPPPGAGASSRAETQMDQVIRLLTDISRQGGRGFGQSAPMNPTGSHVQQASQALMPGKRGF